MFFLFQMLYIPITGIILYLVLNTAYYLHKYRWIGNKG